MVDPANSPLHVIALPALARRCGIDFVDATDPVRRECIAPDGVRLNYLDWGGSGDPIVFLHGGALTAHSWDLVCIGLRDSYRCIALDLRGHGDSGWSDDYRIDTAAADVAALVATLSVASCHGRMTTSIFSPSWPSCRPSLRASAVRCCSREGNGRGSKTRATTSRKTIRARCSLN